MDSIVKKKNKNLGPRRKRMTVFESLMVMVAFASLILAILSFNPKK
jgi:hypothetical protein